MIKTFTLKKKQFNQFLPVTDREYVTGLVVGDYVKVYNKYNQWELYCLTSKTTDISPSVGEKWSAQMMSKGEWLLLEHFDITDVIYFKNKKELNSHLAKHYGAPIPKKSDEDIMGEVEKIISKYSLTEEEELSDDIFSKLETLKHLIDPNNHLRFHQFMYNVNAEFYESQLKDRYQIDIDGRVYARDMFYVENELYEKFIDMKIEEEK